MSKKPRNRYVRYGNKTIVMNGVDPLAYYDGTKRWWQFWKKKKSYVDTLTTVNTGIIKFKESDTINSNGRR